MVAITGAAVELTAVNTPILSVPFAASPIDGWSLVHEYEVVPPVFRVVKLTAVI